jgi:hypothetical protein
LYQATKEAEYKSKLKIYVTTFILFFSIVLMLLIFSPVIYKYFFTDSEDQVNTEAPPTEQTGSSTTSKQPQGSNEQQPGNEQQTTQQNTQTGQNTQNQQQTTQNQNIEGLTKVDIGWKDDKNRVVYVQLENGKYSIQESSWDSEEKASKRISNVGSYNISGLTGSFAKSDLGARGIWYRVRFGEFSTIDEARQKAVELRKKEPR